MQQLIKTWPSVAFKDWKGAADGQRCLWQALIETRRRRQRPALSFQGQSAADCRRRFLRGRRRKWPDLHLQAHAGSGIVRGHSCQCDGHSNSVRPRLYGLDQLAAEAKGNLVLPRCPLEWKKSLLVWGQERGDLWLMRT